MGYTEDYVVPRYNCATSNLCHGIRKTCRIVLQQFLLLIQNFFKTTNNKIMHNHLATSRITSNNLGRTRNRYRTTTLKTEQNPNGSSGSTYFWGVKMSLQD